MNNRITKEELNKLGIYDLRDVARKKGVRSPASKRKDQLITEIIDIQNGVQQPIFNNKFGRPTKARLTKTDILVEFDYNNDTELQEYLRPNKNNDYFVFEQNYDDNNLALMGEPINFKGILRKTEQGAYYALDSSKLSCTTCILFDEKIIETYKLIEGDYVGGTANLYANKNLAKVTNVDKVNNNSPFNNVLNLQQQNVIKDIILDYPDFKQGKFKLLSFDKLSTTLEFISNKAKEYTNKGYKCVVLGLEISIETKLKLDLIDGITDVVSLLDDTCKVSKDKLLDFINYTNSLYNRNCNVVAFVIDFLNIYNILDMLNQSSQTSHNQDTELMIRKIIANNKNSKDASITTYGFYYNYQQESYKKEIERIFNISNK